MPRIMKLHRYIDHDLQMTRIDFQVTRSRSRLLDTVKWFFYVYSRMLTPMIMTQYNGQVDRIFLLNQSKMEFIM